LKPKIWLILRGKTNSRRCPHKVVRDIGGTTLFKLQLTRYLQYITPDRIVASIPAGPGNDLLARQVERMGFPVFRNANNGTFHTQKAAMDFFEIDDQDIAIQTTPDTPFVYLEDLQYKINALLDSDADYTVWAPTGQFPMRDWEWAVGPGAVGKAGWGRRCMEAIDYYGGAAREGRARDLLRMMIETGWNKLLLIETPKPAREPWPWQPLWIDEPEHFEQAKLIIEALGIGGLRDRAIRKLLNDRPEIAQMTANAPRRTTKIWHEDREMMDILERIAERDGTAPQWRGWEEDD